MLFRHKLVISIAATALLAGCSGARNFAVPAPTDESRSLAAIHQIANRLPEVEYELGAGDVVEIKVHGVEKLETTVRIPETGEIDFPLVGKIKASGSTVPEIEHQLAEALGKRYINDPHVTVFIKEYNSYKVSVVGEVTDPGTIILTTGGCTLVDALAAAGGLTKNAGNEIHVTRFAASGKSIVQTVDLDRLLIKGDLDENPRLNPGDSVYVPEAGYIFVTGYVEKPGSYQLKRGMTALQAISTAGDFRNTASRRVKIIRKKPDHVEVKKLDLGDVAMGKVPDVQLQKSDVIEAEASVWRVPVYGTFDFIKSVFGVGTSLR